MKANELRIGNWVNRQFWNPHPKTPGHMMDPCTIEMIWTDSVHVKVNRGGIWKLSLAEIHPITITDEWLEMLGFVDNGQGLFDLFSDLYQFTGRIPEIGFNLRSPVNIPSGQLHYVHQLQNLYFSLTGEELQINQQN